jgi:hypothetical protein
MLPSARQPHSLNQNRVPHVPRFRRGIQTKAVVPSKAKGL